jgi:hypothetical protein
VELSVPVCRKRHTTTTAMVLMACRRFFTIHQITLWLSMARRILRGKQDQRISSRCSKKIPGNIETVPRNPGTVPSEFREPLTAHSQPVNMGYSDVCRTTRRTIFSYAPSSLPSFMPG